MDYFDAIQDTTPAEVTTIDGAVWRLRQPRGRDFDRWQNMLILLVAPAASKLLGTPEAELLAMPEGPERTAKIEAALQKLEREEWQGLPELERERRRQLRDAQDAALVTACVTHCTPAYVLEGEPAATPVRILGRDDDSAPEGVRGLHFWRLPLAIRQQLVKAARRLVGGEDLRRKVDSFRSGVGDRLGAAQDG